MSPFSKLERTLVRKYPLVVGLDEVGRGGLAGPVTAAAVTLLVHCQRRLLGLAKQVSGRFILRDSKTLTAKRREEVFKILKQHPDVEWGIGRVSERAIDRINILEATKLAMARAVKNLEKNLFKKYRFFQDREKSGIIDYLIIDGNFAINLPFPQKSVIRGDEKIFLLKLASIIAKVTRDRTMLRYHKIYSQYRFDKHKGYPTELHFRMLKRYGPCEIHRKTFNPVLKIQKLKLKT